MAACDKPQICELTYALHWKHIILSQDRKQSFGCFEKLSHL
jgi:hypothetical protein